MRRHFHFGSTAQLEQNLFGLKASQIFTLFVPIAGTFFNRIIGIENSAGGGDKRRHWRGHKQASAAAIRAQLNRKFLRLGAKYPAVLPAAPPTES